MLMTSEAPLIASYILSDVGKYRDDNQDAIRVCQPDDPMNNTCGYLYAIADGMGGYAHGGVASTLALDTFFSQVYSNGSSNISGTMKKALDAANLSVYQEARRLGAGRMGTTLTAVNIVGDTMHIAHIGDSRAYLIRDGKSRLLTTDHTMVGELVRMKVLPPDKVRTHAQRSNLQKCLGIDLFVNPDIQKVQVQSGDIIVLCTDGLWAVIEDDEFAMLTYDTPIDSLNQRLFDLALERDTDDNISVVTLHIEAVTASDNGSRASGVGQISKFARRLMGKS
jgi:PPM family protein phosphatase